MLLLPLLYGYILALYLLEPVLSLDEDEIAERSYWFGNAMGVWGLPVMHMLLTLFVTSWVARRAGSAATVAHGVLIALVSVVVGQIAGLLYGPLDPAEVARYLMLALAGGVLGGIEARAALASQEALYEASRRIGAARGPQDIVDAIVDNPASPAANGAALWWSGRETAEDATTTSATTGFRAAWFSRGWPDGLRLEGADAWALTGAERGSSKTLRSGELPQKGRTARGEPGAKSALLVPLISPEGRKIGLLAVVSSGRRFSRSASRSYQTVAAQAALALENLRLVEEAREAGILRERQRMSHEIHDTLAQGFNSIVVNLQAAERIENSDPARARLHLDQVKNTARESLSEARRLVWALRPEALENASLPEALGKLAKRWSIESGIDATASATGAPPPLPPEAEATLFRVAQEALNNVRKHAKGASRVALTLSYVGDTVVLDVRDDGAGFDPTGEAGRTRDRTLGGLGLRGMRERMEGVGGTLSVESAIGEGTALAVELQVTEPELSRAESQRDAEEVA